MKKAAAHRRAKRMAGACLAIATGACECDGIENAAPNGYLDPPILDLGPVPLDTECSVALDIVNNGTADLQVESASLVDSDGEFTITLVPQFVGFGTSESLLLRYVAQGPENVRQTTSVEVISNGRQNGGLLTAVVSALPTNAQAAVATSVCEGDEGGQTPCPALEYGAVQTSDPFLPIAERAGRTLQVQVRNEGNAEMQVLATVIEGGGGDFAVSGLRLGNLLGTTPLRLAPGRDGACGQVSEGSCAQAETCNVLGVDVKYAPSGLGADNATLVILTDAAEGGELRVPLSGFGSDIGIVTTPEFIVVRDTAEGETTEVDVRVANVGTNDAPVNHSCIDIGGDGSCEGDCTGNAPALGGALSCRVTKADGAREGKGFVLGPTDAQEGGDDERIIVVQWAPSAGNASIPPGTTLRLESGILNNKVYEVPIAGGAAGVLGVASEAVCGESLCVQAEGDAADIATWTGSLSLTLRNEGDATLDITSFEWDGPATIADDYVLEGAGGMVVDMAAPAIALAPGAQSEFRVRYANDDASVQDFINLVVNHTGLGGQLTLPLRVVAPSDD